MMQPRDPNMWRPFKWMTPRSSRLLPLGPSRGAPGVLASYALIGAVMAFGAIGYLLDHYLDTAPWFVIGGLFVGICFGFYNLVTTVRRR